MTDVPRLAAGSRRGAPQRAASLPAPQASIAGAQSALTRSHSSAEDTELLSPSAPSTFGQVCQLLLDILENILVSRDLLLYFQ